jgi:hypothetical protein
LDSETDNSMSNYDSYVFRNCIAEKGCKGTIKLVLTFCPKSTKSACLHRLPLSIWMHGKLDGDH